MASALFTALREAHGAAVDDIAGYCGVVRQPGEPDHLLKKRTMLAKIAEQDGFKPLLDAIKEVEDGEA